MIRWRPLCAFWQAAVIQARQAAQEMQAQLRGGGGGGAAAPGAAQLAGEVRDVKEALKVSAP